MMSHLDLSTDRLLLLLFFLFFFYLRFGPSCGQLSGSGGGGGGGDGGGFEVLWLGCHLKKQQATTRVKR